MIRQRRRMDAMRPSTPVLLGDGGVWDLPIPMVYTRPDKPSRTNLGIQFDEMVKAVEDAEWQWEQDIALINLGAYLVRRNYYASDTELSVLLSFDPDAAKKIIAEQNADRTVRYIGNRFAGTSALLEELKRVAFGDLENPTYDRWVRLSIIASGYVPESLPIADYDALAGILEATGRTISRRWVPEIDEAIRQAETQKKMEESF